MNNHGRIYLFLEIISHNVQNMALTETEFKEVY